MKTRITSCLFDKNIFFLIENQITVDINFCGFVSPEKLLENVNINHASVHLIVSWILPDVKINCLCQIEMMH